MKNKIQVLIRNLIVLSIFRVIVVLCIFAAVITLLMSIDEPVKKTSNNISIGKITFVPDVDTTKNTLQKSPTPLPAMDSDNLSAGQPLPAPTTK